MKNNTPSQSEQPGNNRFATGGKKSLISVEAAPPEAFQAESLDPLLYGNIMGQILNNANPFNVISGDVQNTLKSLFSMGAKGKETRKQIQSVQNQINRIEQGIRTIDQPSGRGDLFNRLR